MPLVQREVQPIFLFHGLNTIPDGIADELQYVTNFTLTSIIRQLSDIARLAEDVFVELLSETNLVCQKSNVLQDRIDKISVMVTGLDPAYDQDTLEDFLSKTPYQSELYDDQTILDSKTQPLALQQTRSMCDPVPPLNRLDPYRVDGKEALKTYTNPKYFFELWCQDMERNIKREEKEKAEKVAPQPPHPPPGLQCINVQLVARRESRSNLLDAIRQGIPLKPVPRGASLQNEECDIVKALLDRRQVLAPDYDTDSDTSSYFSTDEEDEIDNDQS